MNTQDLAVSVHRLTKRYGHTEVLKDVNMEIEKGSIYCLLGSNGAGKTTTIKILTTLAAFDSGEVSVCGHSVTAEGEAVRKLISLTGQFASVDEKLSGYENLVMIGKLNHLKTPKKKAGELLAYFSLTEAANRMVSTYSGGMRRKLDIAMSLAGNPQIIFLDEPTAGLDVEGRLSLHEQIRKLKSQGKTIVLASHDMAEVEILCDRIAILNQGNIVFCGTASELTDKVGKKYFIHIKTQQGENTFETDNIENTLISTLCELKSKNIHVLDIKVDRGTLEQHFMELTRRETE